MGTIPVKQIIKIFLAEDALVELEDGYVDNKKILRQEINELIRVLYKSAKMTKVHQTMVVNRKTKNEETGKREFQPEQIPLAECDITKYDLPHDDAWVPKNMEKEGGNVRYYAQAVGDSTWKYLVLFTKYYCARTDKYNETLLASEKDEIAEQPECFEQVIHESLINGVNGIIAKNIDNDFDSDVQDINKELDKDDDEDVKDKRSPPLPGSREHQPE